MSLRSPSPNSFKMEETFEGTSWSLAMDDSEYQLTDDNLCDLENIFANVDEEFLGHANHLAFPTKETFSRPDQQAILREQDAIRGHKKSPGLVHAYSYNDLAALRQTQYQGYPGAQCESPGSSGENGQSRNIVQNQQLQQQPSPTKEFSSRLASIPESSATSMGGTMGGFGHDILQHDVKPGASELEYLSTSTQYTGHNQGMYQDGSCVPVGSMVPIGPMDPVNPYQCANGADSPGLLPITDMAAWDFSNLDMPQGIMSSPLPGTPNAVPGSVMPVDPSTPQSIPQTMPLHDQQGYHATMVGNGHGQKNGKPPIPPQHSSDSLGSQGAPSSGSSGGPPPVSHARPVGGMPVGGGMYGGQPMHGLSNLKTEPANLRRTQSAVELRTLQGGMGSRRNSTTDLNHIVELTTPEGHTYRVHKLNPEERTQKILRYRQKRHERNFTKRIKYQCRKTLADSRPRVRGRFARNDDAGAVMPHESKKAQKAREKQEQQAAIAQACGSGPPAAKMGSGSSPRGVVRGLPPHAHSVSVPQMPPNGIMQPHSPQYVQSPHGAATYSLPPHPMYSPPPMSQVATGDCVYGQTYMTTGYPSSTAYPVQGQQMQPQYAVPAPGPPSYVNSPKPMYANNVVQPSYSNGVYAAPAYSNRQYMAAPTTVPQMVPQNCNPALVSEVPNAPMYMYHNPMETQMTYAPAMSHQQQR
eukprot:jgi/Botrbrau1/2465/Bobra.0226s0024.1